MKFYLEHNKKQKCWRIYDMHQEDCLEPICLITIGDSLMDRYLQAICVLNGAIEIEELGEQQKRGGR